MGRGQRPRHNGVQPRLNIGTIAGLPIAIAAYFWANRLLPADLAGRADWEVHVMFMVWAVMLIAPWFRTARQAWADQLYTAAAMFALLPALNALTTDQHLGVSLPMGAWQHAGFDLTMLAFGLAFGVAAHRLRRSARSREPRTESIFHGEAPASANLTRST